MVVYGGRCNEGRFVLIISTRIGYITSELLKWLRHNAVANC